MHIVLGSFYETYASKAYIFNGDVAGSVSHELLGRQRNLRKIEAWIYTRGYTVKSKRRVRKDARKWLNRAASGRVKGIATSVVVKS
jgi:hypothetical protein